MEQVKSRFYDALSENRTCKGGLLDKNTFSAPQEVTVNDKIQYLQQQQQIFARVWQTWLRNYIVQHECSCQGWCNTWLVDQLQLKLESCKPESNRGRWSITGRPWLNFAAPTAVALGSREQFQMGCQERWKGIKLDKPARLNVIWICETSAVTLWEQMQQMNGLQKVSSRSSWK